MSAGVYSWWGGLCAVSVLNIGAWLATAALLRRQQAQLADAERRLRRWLLGLSAAYVLGCAFRSVLPVYDVPRLCLVDSWLSSVLVGRSVATVAELSFAAQWALLLDSAARGAGSAVGRRIAALVLPLIALAETCSWYSVLTTANIGHVAEESLWAVTAALLAAAMLALWPHYRPRHRPLLALLCSAALAYVAFMALVDVPMYWSRWLADQAQGRPYLGLWQGLEDVSLRRVVSHRWEDWRSEMLWMSLYFSLAVWLSIALVRAPLATARTVAFRSVSA